MANEKPIRKFNLSDPDLALFSSNLVVNMTRDTTEFAIRGVTATDITDFETLENSFEVFPTDPEFQGLITIAAATKNALQLTILDNIQLISGFVQQQWGLNSGEYKRLNLKSINNTKDSVFLVKARVVVRIATEYLTTLSAIGLTQADIDTLNTNAQLFEDKLNDIADAENTREEKTKERIDLGNDVYSFVQEYTTIGKLIWENIDPIKYDDYVINPTTPSSLGKVLNLAGVFIPASGGEVDTIDLSWTSVATATGYEILRSIVPVGNPSAIFAVIVAIPDIVFSDNALPTIPSDYYYKVRAFNETSTGPESNETKIQAV